ncbi:formate dehydrogenase accessory sulfurtransferase FdhD [Natranaerobius thermophilus]|uniref:Sulfur carrier protein FdhD n=1 Tax=Natranaerobius thermophilus (strain ATCC BAA-1301 / DSM 18059 / JW/NM-WN-LF) TaxID=457570 RepID=B2A8F9_NATTJ|nr:formate dehydrogenase accessory sulfurtransferase FdhD [Natranaerobius thermophilus]ACB85843.1 formate dehydrogenase family accessory protein FdhD [Natranaerobius thermophilus JW/NM-WN-LF]
MIQLKGGSTINRIELPVSEERPVDLIVNDQHLTTFMCTPKELKQLAVGHLLARQMITSIADIHMIGACDDMRKIYVKIGKELPEQDLSLGKVIASGCGSGSAINNENIVNRKIDSNFELSETVLKEAFTEMHRQAVEYQRTGGLHSAALVNESGVLTVQEDVGRHNAIDKLLGTTLFKGYESGKLALITTGRLSSDMVLKALGAGFPLVATRSIPTSMALEIAETAGITLVGRAHRTQKYFYCHTDRIKPKLKEGKQS